MPQINISEKTLDRLHREIIETNNTVEDAINRALDALWIPEIP